MDRNIKNRTKSNFRYFFDLQFLQNKKLKNYEVSKCIKGRTT